MFCFWQFRQFSRGFKHEKNKKSHTFLRPNLCVAGGHRLVVPPAVGMPGSGSLGGDETPPVLERHAHSGFWGLWKVLARLRRVGGMHVEAHVSPANTSLAERELSAAAHRLAQASVCLDDDARVRGMVDVQILEVRDESPGRKDEGIVVDGLQVLDGGNIEVSIVLWCMRCVYYSGNTLLNAPFAAKYLLFSVLPCFSCLMCLFPTQDPRGGPDGGDYYGRGWRGGGGAGGGAASAGRVDGLQVLEGGNLEVTIVL